MGTQNPVHSSRLGQLSYAHCAHSAEPGSAAHGARQYEVEQAAIEP
jgi:hypothetical protein